MKMNPCIVCGSKAPILWPFFTKMFHNFLFELQLGIPFGPNDKICCKCKIRLRFLFHERNKILAANKKFFITAHCKEHKVLKKCCRFCLREILFPHSLIDMEINFYIQIILRLKVREDEHFLMICNTCYIRLTVMNQIYQKLCAPFRTTREYYKKLYIREYLPDESLHFQKKVKSTEPLTSTISTRCPICSMDNPTISHFQIHLNAPIICETCRRLLPNIKSYRAHSLCCAQSINFNCEQCPAKFRYKWFYAQHRQNLHAAINLPEISQPVEAPTPSDTTLIRNHMIAIPKNVWYQKHRENTDFRYKLLTPKVEPQVFDVDLFDERQTMEACQDWQNCVNDPDLNNADSEMFNVNVKEEIEDECIVGEAFKTYEIKPFMRGAPVRDNFAKFSKKQTMKIQKLKRKVKIDNSLFDVIRTKCEFSKSKPKKAKPNKNINKEIDEAEEEVKDEIEIDEVKIQEMDETEISKAEIKDVSWEDLRLQEALPWSDQEEGTINHPIDKLFGYLPRQSCIVPSKPCNYKLPHLCSVCGILVRNIKHHILIQHPIGEPEFKCTQCRRAFFTQKTLTAHISRSHTIESFKCDICGNHLRNLQSLRKHQSTFHFDKSVYPCKECKREFNTTFLLKNHMKQHTNLHPFRCDVCGAAFKHNVSVKTHKRNAHNIEETITDYCDICNQGFGSMCAVYTHRRRKHPGSVPK